MAAKEICEVVLDTKTFTVRSIRIVHINGISSHKRYFTVFS